MPPHDAAPNPAARLSVLAAAALFATGGAAIKATTLSSVQVAAFRSGVAALAMLVLLPEARRGYGRALLPAAFALAATLVAFVISTKWTTSAAAIFLQSTAPLWVVVLAPLLLRERIDRRDMPYLAAAVVGLGLVFLGSRDPSATAPQPLAGNAVALIAGFCYALLIVSFRQLARTSGPRDRSLPAAVLGNALAFALCLPFALPVANASVGDAVAIGYLGVVQIGIAYLFLVRGFRSLPALEVSLLLLLEPVLNPVWTWLMHDERPSPLAIGGGALLLATLALRAFQQARLQAA